MGQPPRRAAIVAGFAVIYVVWGTTYLGIRWAVEAMPALLSASLRFLLAGLPMLAWFAATGLQRPRRVDLLRALVLGTLMLAMGNGGVSVAETRMPSGIAALMVATVPLWVTAFSAAFARTAPAPLAVAGIAVGIAGVALLSTTGDGWRGGVSYAHVAVILGGSSAWALGTVISRRHPAALPVMQDTAWQMTLGGLVLLAASAARGELGGWSPSQVPWQGWAAVAYLTLFGSLLALSTYLWLLRHVLAPRVATYAFVNPVVAVALGAAVEGEPFGWKVAAAGALVVAAVAMTLAAPQARPRTPPP